VFEVEQNREPESSQYDLPLKDSSNTEEEDASKESIVLKVHMVHHEEACV